MRATVLALFALLPTMVGPLPQVEKASAITARLCNGGTMTIPFPAKRKGSPAPGPHKGCHAGTWRKRIDPSQ